MKVLNNNIATYDRSSYRIFKIKYYLRSAVPLLVSLILLIIFSGIIIDYFARIPRERSEADLGYTDKVTRGAKMSWGAFVASLNITENHPKQSDLPLVHLHLNGKKIDQLNSNLPVSGREFQSGDIKLDNKVYKVKVRYRGDSLNHWSFPQKSWRVKLTKGKFYEGIQYFNLYQPRTQNQISEVLSYEMAERMGGLLSPRAYYVHFRLNRKFDGMRLFLEQVNQNFLTVRGLIPGDILIGDISTENIYGIKERANLFGIESGINWEVEGLHIDVGSADVVPQAHPRITELLKLLNTQVGVNSEQIVNLKQELPLILDIDSTLRFIALLDLMGSSHIDGTHNHKWYVNPATGRLVPIVWDPIAYYWGNRNGIDIDSNLLFRRVLQVPEFAEAKNKILWEAINSNLSTSSLMSFINETVNRIRKDVTDNPLKIKAIRTTLALNSNADWKIGVDNLRKVVKERNDKIRNILTNNKIDLSVSNNLSGTDLNISVASKSGFTLKEINLKAKFNRTIKVAIANFTNNYDLKNSGKILLNDKLYPYRTLREDGRLITKEGIYKYSISDINPEDIKNIIGINPITLEKIVLTPKIVDNSDKIENSLPESLNKKLKETRLKGFNEITTDLIIAPNSNLIVEAGTTLKLSPGVSIIANNANIEIRGTVNNPVTFTATGDKSIPWGVFATVGCNNVVINNLTVEGGGDDSFKGAYFPGALSLHNSRVNLQNVKINDGELSLQFSTGNANNIQVDTPSGVPIHKEGSGVIFDDKLKIINSNKGFNKSLLNKVVVGTDPRKEQEYKFGFSKSNGEKLDLMEVANAAGLALNKYIKSSEWEAPKLTGTDFWLTSATDGAIYRDVYFDSPEGYAEKYGISYRLRHRFSSIEDHDGNFKYPHEPRFWPYRIEYQAKTDREEIGEGFSRVTESRMEFRWQSKPFDQLRNLPPPPPWSLVEYIPWIQSGFFRGRLTTPGQEFTRELVKVGALKDQNDYVTVKPAVILVSTRVRHHLNIKTPYGTGPNPEQSFIVTFDHADVYPVDHFLKTMELAPKAKKKLSLKPVAEITEMEIEFERNVSEGVAKALATATDKEEILKLKKLQNAFLHDQKQISEVVTRGVREIGIDVKPVNFSKFLQARKLLKETIKE
jgi:hypothetical protein